MIGTGQVMESSAISRLVKVLQLEQKQGYRNKAVIGGLDKFVSRWETDVRAELGNHPAVNEIIALLLGYPAVEDVQARTRILDLVLRRAAEATARVPQASATEKTITPVPPPTAPSEPARAGEPAPAEPEPDRPAVTIPAASKPAAALSEQPPARPPRPDPPPRPAQRSQSQEVTAGPTTAEAPGQTRPGAARGAGEPRAAHSEARGMPRAEHTAGLGLTAPVVRLPGVGPAFGVKLAKLGVQTIRDLLYFLPHRYDDFSRLRTIDKLAWGEEVTVIGTVWNLKTRIIGEDRKLVTVVVGDGTGEMHMTWFNPYVEKQLHVGHAYTFSGKVDSYRNVLMLRNPAFEPLDRHQLNTGRLVPIYGLTEGLSANWLRRVMHHAVTSWAGAAPDFLPERVRQEAQLMPLAAALTQIHFPDGAEQLARAQQRLSFDEFFLLQMGVLGMRRRFRSQAAPALRVEPDMLQPFHQALPFAMTTAQRRALDEIAGDLRTTQPMSRLLQGDVGSGKTAVAAAALWLTVANGAQGALMAPTEILAEQHARSLSQLFAALPVRVLLLTGSLRAAEREAALEAIATGAAHIIVGTHALIQSGVTFHHLALAVVDEQHRFGVEQRTALRQKGQQPHLLVMSATPIPRSLALTVFGDLDVSVLDEMPAGRTPIKTKWLTSSQRERAYDFIRRQAQSGRQAFIIYPLVAGTNDNEDQAAVEEHVRLQQSIFPTLRLGLLHGRLPAEEKDAVMRAFGRGEIDVLVATSVVEVGIDVPNATIIMIEGAERFGLAQLHQFRGRVGRGEHPSYCILISDVADGEGVKRLQALEQTVDGFALAQIDLELRGPGDFFGTRQSGLPPLQAARLSDLATLELARQAARALFERDAALAWPEHRALAERLAAFWQDASEFN